MVSSDAHNCYQVGVFDQALSILEKVGFPEDLIMNLNADRFLSYLKEFRKEDCL